MSTTKFDKEGRRRVCDEHVIKVMPGQEHVIVNRGECHECTSIRSKKYRGRNKEKEIRRDHQHFDLIKHNWSTFDV